MSVDVPPGPGRTLPRSLVLLLGGAAVVVCIAGVKAASGLIGPVFIALMITIAVHPLRDWSTRRGLAPWVGLLIGVTGAYVLILSISLMLVISIARFASLLPQYADKMQDLVDQFGDRLQSLGIDAHQTQSIISAFNPGKLLDFVGEVLSAGLSVSTALIVLLTLLIMMAIDATTIGDTLAAAGRIRPNVARSMRTFAQGTRIYLVTSTVFGLIVAVIDTLILWGLGVPSPVLWGLLAFITNYIPNVGFIIGLLPPAILALLEGGPGLMLWVIAAYCAVNFVIQSVIQPKYVGEPVGLSPTVTFLSLVFWSWVLGAVGALFAVPLTLLVKALFIDVDDHVAWLRPLVSGHPSDRPSDPAG